MVKIIGISGKKQAGKNTVANYMHGKVLKTEGMVRDFFVNKKGELVIETSNSIGETGHGIFDINRTDSDFISYAELELWPYIKLYSFADGLKKLCIDFFNLKPEQVYGTDDQKNTLTKMRWEDMPHNPEGVSGNMSAREFMQYFGTDIMRSMYLNVHVDNTIKRIKSEKTKLAIIADIRFPNEVKSIQDNGGYVIRLTRDRYHDAHDSECGLDQDRFDWNNFDAIIDNSDGMQDSMLEQLENLQHLYMV